MTLNGRQRELGPLSSPDSKNSRLTKDFAHNMQCRLACCGTPLAVCPPQISCGEHPRSHHVGAYVPPACRCEWVLMFILVLSCRIEEDTKKPRTCENSQIRGP